MRHRLPLITDNKRGEAALREQRMTYGVAESDAWNFDSYLLAVIGNGLQYLKDNINSFPDGKEFAEWKDELQRASNDAYWCLVIYDELESELHDKYFSNFPLADRIERSATGITFLTSPLTPEQSQAFREELNDLAAERDRVKDRLMDFIKENFWSLWD